MVLLTLADTPMQEPEGLGLDRFESPPTLTSAWPEAGSSIPLEAIRTLDSIDTMLVRWFL